MANWFDKKLEDLTYENKKTMVDDIAKVLREFYFTSRNGTKKDAITIAETIIDTFSLLLFSKNDLDKEKYNIEKLFRSEIGEA